MSSDSIEITASTLKQAIFESEDLLLKHDLHYGQGMHTALDEAAYLVSFVAGLPPDFCPDKDNIGLNEQQKQRLQECLHKRIKQRIPLAYILGETWLAGVKFKVSPAVLIPRSPIAQLLAQRCSPWQQNQVVQRILDLCTGSGCLGILAAQAFPEASVDISDLDQAALEIAADNIQMHMLADRMNIICSDVYAQIPYTQYDIIVANPPYVPVCEQAQLPAEFAHEPQHALFSGDDGLRIVTQVIAGATTYLQEHGILVLEVGQYADVLQDHYPHYPIMWHELEEGGEGVCVLTREDCQQLVNSAHSSVHTS